MLEADGACLGVDVLVEGAPEGGGQDLKAAADAEDGYLTVGGEAGEQEFLTVAAVIDGVEFVDGFLAQVERVDVAPAGEQESVKVFEGGEQCVRIVVRGDDEGKSSGTEDGGAIAVG